MNQKEFLKNEIQKAKNFVLNRKHAYLSIFKEEDAQDTEVVLEDLKKFCRGGEFSTFHLDSRMHAKLEGRREAYNRILVHLKLDGEELYRYFGGKE